MKKHIVITSIFEPTEAVLAFAKMKDCKLIVVGDQKSPKDWHCDNVEYMSVETQQIYGFELAKVLPYNHYSRKMLGYLKAAQGGASCIVDTDDDNIPKQNWGFPDFVKTCDCIDKNLGFVNIYQLYTKQKIWPRGLPLKLINQKFNLHEKTTRRKNNIGIWQGLADEDPDVDAIYRLTDGSLCYFEELDPVAIGMGTISPFNSQNTITRRELFSLLYLPTHVTFRFTDILRGLVAQPIMWLHGFQLGFIKATVVQKRNIHDYMQDFISELPMYQECKNIPDIVAGAISENKNIEENLYEAYRALLEKGVVCEKEMETLTAWLMDLQECN